MAPGILARAFQQRELSMEALFSEANEAKYFSRGVWTTATGLAVSPETALQTTAVLACVRVLAESLASLPLVLYRRLERGKERAVDHYLYPILHDQANPEMTSFELREALQSHLATWGNAFANIELGGDGRARALWPLRPDRMQVYRIGGRLFYKYQLPQSSGGGVRWMAEREVLHIRGLSPDGIVGYSPIQLARQAVGLSLAMEEFGARFFGNGANPGVALEHPGTLSDQAYKHLKESWEEEHQGLTQAHRFAILEEGIKIEKIGIPPEDSQFIQSRKFQVDEIARLYRMPPHMIQDLEHATFSNIEHQAIEFVVHTLRPWLVRWEQRLLITLLSAEERKSYFPEFLVAGLQRGDMVARYTAYVQARQNGWLSANEIRELENMNPVEGGDVYLVPLNMIPADQVGSTGALGGGFRAARDAGPAWTERAATTRRRLSRAHEQLFLAAAERIVRSEIREVRKAAEKHLKSRDAGDFSAWLERFYEGHREYINRQMLAPLMSFAEVVAAEAGDEAGISPESLEALHAEMERFVDAYAQAYVQRHVGSSIGQIRSVVGDAIAAELDPIVALDERFDEWDETRPGRIAAWESVQSNNAVAKFVFAAGGITMLRWVSSASSCPYCQDLDGKVVSIESNFIGAGEDFQPEGAETPLRPDVDVGHPPAHAGCDCVIVPDVGRSVTEPQPGGHQEERQMYGPQTIARALDILERMRGPQIRFDVDHMTQTHAPEVRVEVTPEALQPVADALERGVGRVGEALDGLQIPSPTIEVKPEVRIEPRKADGPPLLLSREEKQTVDRDKDQKITGTKTHVEYKYGDKPGE